MNVASYSLSVSVGILTRMSGERDKIIAAVVGDLRRGLHKNAQAMLRRAVSPSPVSERSTVLCHDIVDTITDNIEQSLREDTEDDGDELGSVA